MPASFEAKAWNKASKEGGEDGIQGTEMRAASGKKRPVFVPLGGSRWVKRDITGGSRGYWEGCWEASTQSRDPVACRTSDGQGAWWEGD